MKARMSQKRLLLRRSLLGCHHLPLRPSLTSLLKISFTSVRASEPGNPPHPPPPPLHSVLPDLSLLFQGLNQKHLHKFGKKIYGSILCFKNEICWHVQQLKHERAFLSKGYLRLNNTFFNLTKKSFFFTEFKNTFTLKVGKKKAPYIFSLWKCQKAWFSPNSEDLFCCFWNNLLILENVFFGITMLLCGFLKVKQVKNHCLGWNTQLLKNHCETVLTIIFEG